jgi:hypothetical protein
MAVTTINAYSDEITANLPPLYKPLKPNVYEGRVRIADWTLTLASQVAGTNFALCRLPKGARIITGVISASATLANSAQISIGLAAVDGSGLIDAGLTIQPDGGAATGTPESDQVACLKAAAVQGTTQVPFAITQALGYLYETAKEVFVTMTTSVGTVATEVVRGHVLYVVD